VVIINSLIEPSVIGIKMKSKTLIPVSDGSTGLLVVTTLCPLICKYPSNQNCIIINITQLYPFGSPCISFTGRHVACRMNIENVSAYILIL